MLIYRVEHKDTGEGPYSYDMHKTYTDERIKIMGASQDRETHPSVWFDIHPSQCALNPLDYFCGFDSIEALLIWFAGWYDTLQSNGFIVSIYDAQYTNHGTYQSTFHKPTATIVSKVSIESLLMPESDQF